jgi:DNA segregation ATPase FtsK/SpoIIIE, S-DNA-T family
LYVPFALSTPRNFVPSVKNKKSKKDTQPISEDISSESSSQHLSRETRRAVIAIILALGAILMIMSALGVAGQFGVFLHQKIMVPLFGYGMILAPLFLVFYAIRLYKKGRPKISWIEAVSSMMAFVGLLAFLHLVGSTQVLGGFVGRIIGQPLITLFDRYATGVILIALIGVSLMLLLNRGLPHMTLPAFMKRREVTDDFEYDTEVSGMDTDPAPEVITRDVIVESSESKKTPSASLASDKKKIVVTAEEEAQSLSDFDTHMKERFGTSYAYPPLHLLSQTSGRPSSGDIKAQSNLIKRTLLNFGIHVEMDEVSIGPTVTRYALKPAEGVKLSRIVALQNDLALALAAHPLRIEAPIPGKSLVGIEVPNKAKATVGLASLLQDSHFSQSTKRLFISLGKGVTGKSYFADIAKMPHLLIAGATGAGKSVTVHNLIISLLYRNSPEELRLIMVDPKRVELTLYNNIPHLLTPVIKEPKKAILALKWAGKEMERRYDILESHAVRDIGSYHDNIVKPAYEKYEAACEKAKKKGSELPSADELPEKMPYIVIFLDELADIMQAYPRELESAIVRLAQMSRAVGIHLILSTQRPSVNVITGLIKANVPARLALQVASQIDSRTILDTSGAESLLGAGDMLYLGSDMSKPERIQCAYISEDEVKRIVEYIKENNEGTLDDIAFSEDLGSDGSMFSASLSDENDEDDLYEDARAIVIEAGKASTSYLQRKLKVGYSRAARLMDMLEERGVIGPADGAKPREILESAPNQTSYEDTL